MPAEVLYRKWRPQRFADVAGQDVVTRTLINALARHRVSHAYLFSGPRGTGKTTTARLLAKAINCERNAEDAKERPGEPCNDCASCVAYNEGRALDLVEMDAASNRGINEIRELREKANFAPTGGAGAHKVYLIDEVHMLTTEAFNALLKTLEEPPPHIVFILATTDAHKVPATILSRCQRHDFRRIPLAATVDRLAEIAEAEEITIARDGLELIARSATGSLRDAINLLEQVCDSYGKDASVDSVREALGLVGDERAGQLALHAARGDLAGGLTLIGAVRDDGLDLRQFQKEIVARLRDLLLVQAGAGTERGWTAEQIAAMKEQVEGIAPAKLVQLLRLFSEADLKADPLSPLPLELALAESVVERAASAPARATAPVHDAGPPARPAPPIRDGAPMQRPGAPPARPAQPAPPPRATEQRRPAAPQRPAATRANITNASAEDIAAMVGSKAPVIPPAPDEPDDEPANAPPAGNGHSAPTASEGSGDFDGVLTEIRKQARARAPKYDALLNGSCRIVSWQDGVLTLGFFQDSFHKKTTEEAANRRVYEEIASDVLGAPVSLRCIIAPRAPRALSPLVQHAVENHGAQIISEE